MGSKEVNPIDGIVEQTGSLAITKTVPTNDPLVPLVP